MILKYNFILISLNADEIDGLNYKEYSFKKYTAAEIKMSPEVIKRLKTELSNYHADLLSHNDSLILGTAVFDISNIEPDVIRNRIYSEHLLIPWILNSIYGLSMQYLVGCSESVNSSYEFCIIGMTSHPGRTFPLNMNMKRLNSEVEQNCIEMIIDNVLENDFYKELVSIYNENIFVRGQGLSIINLITILEMIFSDSNTEVSYKVARGTAVFLCNDVTDGNIIYDKVKALYNIRSKYIHEGNAASYMNKYETKYKKNPFIDLKIIVSKIMYKLFKDNMSRKEIIMYVLENGFDK